MKKVNKYVSTDGREFNDEVSCRKYEEIIAAVEMLMKQLPKLPARSAFANGEGYLQHDKKTFCKVWNGFYKIACELHPSIKREGFELCSYGFGRTLDDSGSPLYGYYVRYLCTNHVTFREYGQPYYVTHCDEAVDTRLN